MSNDKPLAGSVLPPGDDSCASLAGIERNLEKDGEQTSGSVRTASGNRKLERKIFASKLALLFEQAAPRLWLLVSIIALFIVVSLAGLWTALAPLLHKIVLGIFALALVLALVLLARLRWPDRERAIRRLERISNVLHRPASSYEDEVSSATGNPAARILWQEHRKRLARTIDKLRVGPPAPRTDRHDPLALRALMLLGVFVLTAIAGDNAADRIQAAFHFGASKLSATARLDAWVTPPAYTVKPPIMLSDGSRPAPTGRTGITRQIELPQNSELVVRLSGTSLDGFALEITRGDSDTPERIDARTMAQARKNSGKTTDRENGLQNAGNYDSDSDLLEEQDAGELRHIIRSSSLVRVLSGRSEIARYRFAVIPDRLPQISLIKLPVRQRRGQLKLAYEIKDDYGVTHAQARFELLPEPKPDPQRAWARKPPKTGKRPKRPAAPVLNLTLPRNSRKNGKAKSTHELAKHAWAGRKVRMTLIAKDHAGQTGRSKSIDLRLPERWFRNPLARAIIEQRRHLMWDSRNRNDVLFALNAISKDPEDFFKKSMGAYLGLRSAYHRLRQPPTEKRLQSVAEQLWQVAVRIEDGNLTAAERRLRDAQDRLSKLLQDKNASSKEIAKAMEELRQALADYMKQLAQNAPQQPQNPNGTGKDQYITSQDFERMLRQLENMARSGNRDAAQQMLSEMRDLIDRMRSGRQAANRSSRQQQQMMKMMDEFGDLIRKQQKLLDDTFRKQQQQGQRQGREQRQNGQQGQNNNRQRARRDGGKGKGQRGQQGQKPGENRGNRPGGSQLADRQGQLRDMLDRLGRQMEQFGLKKPGQFGKAGEEMDKSRRALGKGRYGEGVRRESRALEQLRKGAQSMAEQMLSRMARRYGQRGQQRRSFDPLGRPRSGSSEGNGTEFSSRVQVPDKFRAQRSREILKELRRRLGESKRPRIELDYIERLLKQF